MGMRGFMVLGGLVLVYAALAILRAIFYFADVMGEDEGRAGAIVPFVKTPHNLMRRDGDNEDDWVDWAEMPGSWRMH